MNTSDNRFLFYLPWEGHVLVGTTDTKIDYKEDDTEDDTHVGSFPVVINKSSATTPPPTKRLTKAEEFINTPTPSEKEILWLLNEAKKYLSSELELRREVRLLYWFCL